MKALKPEQMNSTQLEFNINSLTQGWDTYGTELLIKNLRDFGLKDYQIVIILMNVEGIVSDESNKAANEAAREAYENADESYSWERSERDIDYERD